MTKPTEINIESSPVNGQAGITLYFPKAAILRTFQSLDRALAWVQQRRFAGVPCLINGQPTGISAWEGAAGRIRP